VRRASSEPAHSFLPPVYYGTVDATLLWVCLLADAWRWGMDADQVRALIPSAERALAWMADYGTRMATVSLTTMTSSAVA